MNSALLLALPTLVLCGDGIVTKQATEVVYICDPSNITSEYTNFCSIETSAFSPDPQTSAGIGANSSTIDPADPDPNHDGLVDVSIFNDREAGKIMAEYTWDCNYCNCSAFSGYLEAQNGTILSKRNHNNGYDAWKDIGDIEGEIKDTTKIDPDLIHANELLANHTYLGALSVYEDVARNLDLSTNENYPELYYFKNIWEIMWTLFKKNNNKKPRKNIQKARDAAGILLLMVPNTYMIQTKEYENVRTYINERFNRSDNEPANAQPPDNWKIVDTLKNDQPLNEDETNFVRKLASDYDASQSYVLHMLNIYYQYGKTHGVEASDDADKKRIVYGWGAMKKETDAQSSYAIADTAKGWASLFGVGIPLAAVYAAFDDPVGVPLTPPQIEDSVTDRTYSSIHESTTASSISSTTSTTSTTSSTTSTTCQSIYQTEIEDDDWFSVVEASLDAEDTTTIDVDKRALPTATTTSDTSPDIVARADSDLTVDTPKLKDYCKGAPDVDTCEKVLKRHTVELDPKKWKYKNIPNDLDSKSFYMYNGAGSSKAFSSSNQLPVYVVNALGQSPGVACNALKYIATSYQVNKLFNGFQSKSDAQNGRNGMLTLVRGKRHTRGEVKDGRKCSSPSQYKDSDWMNIDPGRNSKGKQGGYSGKNMQLDEFPPLSANLVVDDTEYVAVTCVPDYDNSRDGTALGRFYTANGPKGNLEDFWNSKCPKLTPGISNYTDFANYMPTIEKKGSGRSPLTAVSPKDYRSFVNDGGSHAFIGNNKAFIVVVNTKDTEGNDIKCERYTEGSQIAFYTIS